VLCWSTELIGSYACVVAVVVADVAAVETAVEIDACVLGGIDPAGDLVGLVPDFILFLMQRISI
jgi:hypothetical protein